MVSRYEGETITYFRTCKLRLHVAYIIDNHSNHDFHDESKVEKSLVTRFGFVVTSQELDFLEMILVFLRNFG